MRVRFSTNRQQKRRETKTDLGTFASAEPITHLNAVPLAKGTDRIFGHYDAVEEGATNNIDESQCPTMGFRSLYFCRGLFDMSAT